MLDACSVHCAPLAAVIDLRMLAAGLRDHAGPHDRRRSLGRLQSRRLQVQRHRRSRGAQARREGLQEDHAALDAHRRRQLLRATSSTPRRSSISSCRASPSWACATPGASCSTRTLGVGGLFDVATRGRAWKRTTKTSVRRSPCGASAPDRISTLPFFGPSSLRDAPSRVVDFFFDPLDVHRHPVGSRLGQARRSTSCIRAPSCCRSIRRCSAPTTRTRSCATRGCSSASSRSSTAIRRRRRSMKSFGGRSRRTPKPNPREPL